MKSPISSDLLTFQVLASRQQRRNQCKDSPLFPFPFDSDLLFLMQLEIGVAFSILLFNSFVRSQVDCQSSALTTLSPMAGFLTFSCLTFSPLPPFIWYDQILKSHETYHSARDESSFSSNLFIRQTGHCVFPTCHT